MLLVIVLLHYSILGWVVQSSVVLGSIPSPVASPCESAAPPPCCHRQEELFVLGYLGLTHKCAISSDQVPLIFLCRQIINPSAGQIYRESWVRKDLSAERSQ